MSRASATYALFVPFVLLLEAVLVVRREKVLLLASLNRGNAAALAFVILAWSSVLLLLALWVFIQNRTLPRDHSGRMNYLIGAFAGMVHAAGNFAVCALVMWIGPVTFLQVSPSAGPPRMFAWALFAVAAIICLSGAMMLLSSVIAWFYLPKRVRTRIWMAADLLLLAAVVAGWFLLPSQPPPENPNALELPILRLVLIALAVLRLTSRLVPVLLDLVEAVGFQTMVAARHLRAHKSGFLAAISVLSVLAVTVSCCALTTTLSVMGGFRSDLKRKILGHNAHVIIDREHDGIEAWEPLLSAVSRTRGVSGASPYVSGEVMLSSASNLATAILRGIDPETVGDTTDLHQNLKSGGLQYLEYPERLLSLPDEQLNAMILPLRTRTKKRLLVKETAGERGPDNGGEEKEVAKDDKDGLDGKAAVPGEVKQERLDGVKRKDKNRLLDTYLKEKVEEKIAEREVLPGIILGQELARALRVYLGDEVNVVAPLGALGPSGPMPKTRAFRVAGVFFSGMYEYDMKHAYVELGTAQRFLNTSDAIHGIEVKVVDPERAPATAVALRKVSGGRRLRIRDWQELNSRLFGALELEKLVMFLVLGIAILVASFCIAGTLTLMVQEKGREVAVLKAMGTPDRAVVGVFIVEGGLIGMLGAALGLFLGYMVCFSAQHLKIPPLDPEVYYIDHLPVHIDGVEFAMVGLAAVMVCLAVTIYPAFLANKLRPVEALRYE